jgi:hypothetical protein
VPAERPGRRWLSVDGVATVIGAQGREDGGSSFDVCSKLNAARHCAACVTAAAAAAPRRVSCGPSAHGKRAEGALRNPRALPCMAHPLYASSAVVASVPAAWHSSCTPTQYTSTHAHS